MALIVPFGRLTAQELFVALASTMMIFSFITFAPTLIADGDSYWHVAAGNWIMAHGTVPHNDPFSFSFAGAPWTAHEWLSELIMAAVYNAGGFSGLYVLFGLCAGAMALILALTLFKYLDPIPATIVLMLALLNVADAMQARPQFLALPILAVWMAELLAARSESRAPRLVLLAPLMMLWVNLHGSFILGLAILAPFGLEALLDAARENRPAVLRDWAIAGGVALLASLANPNGIYGVFFPLQLMAMPAMSTIVEWQSSNFDRLRPLEVTLLATLAFCLVRGVRMGWIRLLLLLGLLHMTLQHQRYSVILAVIGALILAEPIAGVFMAGLRPGHLRSEIANPKHARRAAAVVLTLALIVGGLRLATPKLSDPHYAPEAALSAVPAALAQRPVFNQYEYGGYLILHGVKPFIDGRADMYDGAFINDYIRIAAADKALLEKTFAKYDIAWTILKPDVRAVAVLDSLPNWHRVYADERAVIHVRADAE